MSQDELTKEERTKFQTPVRFTLHDFERRQRERDRALTQRLIQQVTRATTKPAAFAENPQFEKLLADPELAAAVLTRSLRKDLDAYIAARAEHEGVK